MRGDALFAKCREVQLAPGSRKRPAGVTPPTLSCNCRLVGPVPLLCIPLATSTLIGSTQRRLTPLHAGMAKRYRGRLAHGIGWNRLSIGLGRCGELHHYRRIRQFVRSPAAARKMRRQLPRHRLDPLDRAAVELARPKIRFHLAADFLPAIRADLGIDAAVSSSSKRYPAPAPAPADPGTAARRRARLPPQSGPGRNAWSRRP